MEQQPTSTDLNAHPLRDSLTRALSRPQFAKSIEDEKLRADATGVPFVLCLIDIDKLRNINDEHGQRLGDAVLAEVASRIRKRLDDLDWDKIEYLHARFDGDALILLARDCGLRQGQQLAESLRCAVNEEPISDWLDVTVSIGVAQYRIGESTDAVIARTERTLYVAKQFGRDRVEVAPMPDNHRDANVVPLWNRAAPNGRRTRIRNC
jgi:diguanylate cyclase (GGDEF)-like protein